MKELKFKQIIENIIGDINEAKRKSTTIHTAGNIKASGDEVEDLIREKMNLFLPERYLVKQGHIVNAEGKVRKITHRRRTTMFRKCIFNLQKSIKHLSLLVAFW